MRALASLLTILAVSALSAPHAHAQAKAKAPSGPEIRYFTYLTGLMDDRADVILKETRQSGRVTAMNLDVCFPTPGNPERTDRFALDLAVSGDKMSGTTQSQDDKLPVSVNLTRKPNGKTVDITGAIVVGKTSHAVTSTEMTNMSEREYNEQQTIDDTLETSPAAFTSVSPEALSVKVKRAAVLDFVKTLRGENIQVALFGLIASCAELRSGEQVLRLTVDPERAQATLAALRGKPGVVVAGWTDGNMDMERTIRFPAGPWREAGKIDRAKVTQAVTDNLAKSLSATLVGSKWNDTTGELTVNLKRPSGVLPGLGLTENISVVVMVAADRPDASEHLLLWAGSPAIETVDEQAGPKLLIGENAGGNDEESLSPNDGQMLAGLAAAFKAQRWDSETTAWK
ncbi:MAG: hypothetical protein R3D69_13280 [Xanthobacteraceae bacterium]